MTQTPGSDDDFDTTTGRWLLATVIIGSAMAFIDGSGLNIAMPVMQREFGVDTTTMQWVVEAYMVLLAALTLIGGALGDQYGRRRCYAIGIALFALASLVAAAAQTPHQLIAARALQGVGGALLIPGGLALIAAYFPPLQRGKAIGTWAAFGAVTGMLAPLLAGWLVETFSWRWIFIVNLPLSVTALAMLFNHVPESNDPSIRGLPDWRGGLLASCGLALLIFVLLEIPRRNQPDTPWTTELLMFSATSSLLLLVLFLFHERRRETRGQPAMMPLSLFQSRQFSGVNLATLLLYTSLNGALFFLPFFLIQARDLSPTQAGATLIPMSIGIFLLSRWAGRLATDNPRPLLLWGPLVVACAYWLLGAAGQGVSYTLSVLPAMTLVGIGMGMTIAPITHIALGSVGTHRSGIASGINNAVARLSAVLGIALFGLVLSFSFNRQLNQSLAQIDADKTTISHFASENTKLAAAQPPTHLNKAEQQRIRHLVSSAFASGFTLVCHAAALLALATSLCFWLTLPKQWHH